MKKVEILSLEKVLMDTRYFQRSEGIYMHITRCLEMKQQYVRKGGNKNKAPSIN